MVLTQVRTFEDDDMKPAYREKEEHGGTLERQKIKVAEIPDRAITKQPH